MRWNRPLIPVLVDMEFEGVKVDAAALAEFAAQLAKEMDRAPRRPSAGWRARPSTSTHPGSLARSCSTS